MFMILRSPPQSSIKCIKIKELTLISVSNDTQYHFKYPVTGLMSRKFDTLSFSGEII